MSRKSSLVDVARIELQSGAFVHTGVPSEEAINGQYGRGLCQALCGSLSDLNLHFCAEDWGWLVETTVNRDEVLGAEAHEVRVYDFGLSGCLDEPAWTLEVATLEKARWLRFFSTWKPISVNPDFATRVLDFARSEASGEVVAELVQKDRSGNDRGSRPFEVSARS